MPDAAARRTAERRFAEAVALLLADSEDALWVRLDEALVGDDRVPALCSGLEASKHVLSLDLSANPLTGAGVAALCSALASGAAPDLIELRLRGVDLGEEGAAAVEGLHVTRKTLRVETGELALPPPAAAGPEGGAAARQQQHHQHQHQHHQQQHLQAGASGGGALATPNGVGADAGRDGGGGSLVRRYFQMGNGEDDDDEEEEEQGGQTGGAPEELDAEQVSVLYWDQVRLLCGAGSWI